MVQLRLYVGDLEEEDYGEIKSRLDEELNNGEEDYEIISEEPDGSIAPLTGDLPYLSFVNDTLEKPHSVEDKDSINAILENIDESKVESPETST